MLFITGTVQRKRRRKVSGQDGMKILIISPGKMAGEAGMDMNISSRWLLIPAGVMNM